MIIQFADLLLQRLLLRGYLLLLRFVELVPGVAELHQDVDELVLLRVLLRNEPVDVAHLLDDELHVGDGMLLLQELKRRAVAK